MWVRVGFLVFSGRVVQVNQVNVIVGVVVGSRRLVGGRGDVVRTGRGTGREPPRRDGIDGGTVRWRFHTWAG